MNVDGKFIVQKINDRKFAVKKVASDIRGQKIYTHYAECLSEDDAKLIRRALKQYHEERLN